MLRVLSLAALGAGVLAARQRVLHWGATPEEVAAEYSGDALIPNPSGRSTMAVTLPAAPESVWPWLVQMGADRAGWYSWDRLDNGGRPSATEIVPKWQELREGDRLNATTDGRVYFVAAIVDPPSTLVLRSDVAMSSGQSFDPRGPLPKRFIEGVWGFHLTELPNQRTRLVVRTVGRNAPRPVMAVFDFLVGEPAHLIMQLRQFGNLRRRVRAEALPAPKTT
ncbi:hypothetical protein [Nocardia sp. NPDC005366]|uniref:hypothetical protein n=1 Tax=Nocardia sp. NPDC005366 TaxID=3156878 RepID=UPI0033B256F7